MGWHEAHPWVAFCDLRDEHAAELRYHQRLVASVEAREAVASPLTEGELRVMDGNR
jgi:hypothetical protein